MLLRWERSALRAKASRRLSEAVSFDFLRSLRVIQRIQCDTVVKTLQTYRGTLWTWSETKARRMCW